MTITRATPVNDLPELCRVEEVAAWMDVGKGVIYEMIHCGRLASVRLGRLVRIPRAALAAFANGEEK